MGAFKLGKMTFGSLFKKPETVLYPLESKPQPEGLKGHIGIDVESCILCGMCDRSCSTDCITVDKGEGFWEIDRYACVQCGYCVTVCPKKCLHMLPDYAAAATTRDAERFMVPKSESIKKGKASSGKGAGAPSKAKDEAQPARKRTDQADSPAGVVVKDDEQIERLIALLDNDKAEKVRFALDAK